LFNVDRRLVNMRAEFDMNALKKMIKGKADDSSLKMDRDNNNV